MKKVVLTVLCISWMLVIFLFSSQNATKSQGTSDIVATHIIHNVTKITNKSISMQEKEEWIENTRWLIRKGAHFTAYFILGILVYLTLDSYNVEKKYLLTILFCLFYASTDEFHQMFSAGRTARILDIVIDTCGGVCGSSLCLAIFNHRNKKGITNNTCNF